MNTLGCEICLDNIDNADMLSKSKGQILRVAATLHVMFHINTPLTIPDNEAVKAAIDLVDVCIQHAALLAGRGDVNDRVEELARGTGHVDCVEYRTHSVAKLSWVWIPFVMLYLS